jgi:succinate dehydrogenase/fumarate reductase-like Fe-S protein
VRFEAQYGRHHHYGLGDGIVTDQTIPIYIMGQRVEVPPTLTIIKALEYAGYTLTRGVGCRSGFCGACATVYRIKGDPTLHFALACQTVVVPNMYLAQIPFFPARRADYRLSELEPTAATLFTLYPEILRCLACGTCSKACPQEIDVRAYMAAAMRGDIAAVADISFDCIACGLCSARCPVEETQYNVALLSRRLYGRYLAPRSAHLEQRIEEIKRGDFNAEIASLKAMDRASLQQLYNSRDIEPE